MERRDLRTDLELKASWARSDWAEAGHTHLDRSTLDRAHLDRSALDRSGLDQVRLYRAQLEKTLRDRMPFSRERSLKDRPMPDRLMPDRVDAARMAMERTEAAWADSNWARGGGWLTDHLGGGHSIGPDPYQPASSFHVWASGLLTIGLWPFFVLEWLHHRHLRNKQRQQLEKMPDHMLKDIGLTRSDIYSAFGNPPRR